MPHVTSQQVRDELKGLNLNGASGSDEISAIFLSKCAEVLCVPLANLINFSIDRGEYPSILKRNNVIPIFKKGKKIEVTNYRGISLQPIIGKVFERFVKNALRSRVKLLICEEQHGFMPCCSTATNLSVYTEIITKCLDNKSQLHTIYTDFKKAFDLVPHHLLLLKLSKQFGIEGVLYKWFHSYLNGRKQRVCINGVNSEWYDATSGIP